MKLERAARLLIVGRMSQTGVGNASSEGIGKGFVDRYVVGIWLGCKTGYVFGILLGTRIR